MSEILGLDKKQRYLIVIAITILGGIWVAAANPSEPGTGFYSGVIFFGGIAFLALTEEGRDLVRQLFSNVSNQQQEVLGDSTPERNLICSNCGWRNPDGNNYCHDCGSELISDNDSEPLPDDE